jgi:hypothetical protein
MAEHSYKTLRFVVEIPTLRTALYLFDQPTCVTFVLMSSRCFVAVIGTSNFVQYVRCVHKNLWAVS